MPEVLDDGLGRQRGGGQLRGSSCERRHVQPLRPRCPPLAPSPPRTRTARSPRPRRRGRSRGHADTSAATSPGTPPADPRTPDRGSSRPSVGRRGPAGSWRGWWRAPPWRGPGRGGASVDAPSTTPRTPSWRATGTSMCGPEAMPRGLVIPSGVELDHLDVGARLERRRQFPHVGPDAARAPRTTVGRPGTRPAAASSGRRHGRSASMHSQPSGPTVAPWTVPGARSSRSPASSVTSPSSVWNTIEPSRQNSTLW